jgi:hypothetical protein
VKPAKIVAAIGAHAAKICNSIFDQFYNNWTLLATQFVNVYGTNEQC